MQKEEIENEEEVEMRNPIRSSVISGSASGQDPRMSRGSLPQVMVYRAIVRLSQSSAQHPQPPPKPAFWRRFGRKNGNHQPSSQSMPPMR
ncbi:hypothetical protein EVAR_61680_1 [Eumeta japonica]|uniref:Uncharacterized protein n=1 Tax=Eumeta variegata TaxID=151549 RepID=A0A4C1YVX3_EUMVA|nr:hypothetical protein EVAR_61680_1 [Eumeta japonica]